MKSTKIQFAFLLALVFALGCAAESKNEKTQDPTYADYLVNDNSVRGLTFKDYVKLTNLKPKDTTVLITTWKQWEAENWAEMNSYIHKNGLNDSFPTAQGFVNVEVVSLMVGDSIDRYNSIYGQFFAPQGASFGGRSLPATDSTHVYTAYKVIKQIDSVLKGRAIPWYGEPGLGIQYMTNKADIDLLKEGYLIMTDSIPAHMAMK